MAGSARKIDTQMGGGAATGSERNPTDWMVGWQSLFWGSALVMGANVFLWVWDYKFAFTAGLNSASHEFTLYYRTLFWGELVSLGVFTGLWYGWLMRTGRQLATEPFSRAEEVRRIAVLWSIIGITSLSIYIEARVSRGRFFF
jgi:methane/ammonia monooxygenase subunit C